MIKSTSFFVFCYSLINHLKQLPTDFPSIFKLRCETSWDLNFPGGNDVLVTPKDSFLSGTGADEGRLGTGAEEGLPVCNFGRRVSEEGLAELTLPPAGRAEPTLADPARAEPTRLRILGLSSSIVAADPKPHNHSCK